MARSLALIEGQTQIELGPNSNCVPNVSQNFSLKGWLLVKNLLALFLCFGLLCTIGVTLTGCKKDDAKKTTPAKTTPTHATTPTPTEKTPTPTEKTKTDKTEKTDKTDKTDKTKTDKTDKTGKTDKTKTSSLSVPAQHFGRNFRLDATVCQQTSFVGVVSRREAV